MPHHTSFWCRSLVRRMRRSTFALGNLNSLSLVRLMKSLTIGLSLSKVYCMMWLSLYWVSCGLCRFQCRFKVPGHVWDDGSSGSLGQPSGHEQILVTKNRYKWMKIKIDLSANRTLMAPRTLICVLVSKINLTRTFGISNCNCNPREWVSMTCLQYVLALLARTCRLFTCLFI